MLIFGVKDLVTPCLLAGWLARLSLSVYAMGPTPWLMHTTNRVHS